AGARTARAVGLDRGPRGCRRGRRAHSAPAGGDGGLARARGGVGRGLGRPRTRRRRRAGGAAAGAVTGVEASPPVTLVEARAFFAGQSPLDRRRYPNPIATAPASRSSPV